MVEQHRKCVRTTTPWYLVVLILLLTLMPSNAMSQTVNPSIGVDIGRELMITNLSVVQDPIRTNPVNGNKAVWSFKYLIEQMAGNQDPAEFVRSLLESWMVDQTVNGFTAPARLAMVEKILDPWLEASGGQKLDLSQAPFKLLAIVNRLDLRTHDGPNVTTAGEGRFVFGVLDPKTGGPLLPIAGGAEGGFTVILEYELVATDLVSIGQWAHLWHTLGAIPFEAPGFNEVLEVITRKFSDAGSAPYKPNGNALNQLRTNEISLASPWEMREFVIDGTTGRFQQTTVKDTPDINSMNKTQAFADLLNNKEGAILDGTFDLADELYGAHAPVPSPAWQGPTPDSINKNVRHIFAVNTCSGCHRRETGTAFLHVGFPRGSRTSLPATGLLPGPAQLSGFLNGADVVDPLDENIVRRFDDLARRKADFEALLSSYMGGQAGPIDRVARPRSVH